MKTGLPDIIFAKGPNLVQKKAEVRGPKKANRFFPVYQQLKPYIMNSYLVIYEIAMFPNNNWKLTAKRVHDERH